MAFTNTYEDGAYAAAYAALQFPGTYYLAYRDLPAIFAAHVNGRRALDFGCGAGRSTRFLRQHGYDAVGVDISESMIRQARQIDPGGDYRLIEDGDFSGFDAGSFDLVLSVFTFDNVPTMARKVALFSRLARLLGPDGCLVNVVSSPDMYTHEWVSISTKDFPENLHAGPGDAVRTVITAIGDSRPVDDILWPDESYRDVFARTGLEVVETCRPLGREDEPVRWVSETSVAPWVIYVLKRAG